MAGSAIAEAWRRCREAEVGKKGSDAAHAAKLDSQRKPGRETLARQKINSFRRQNARLAERAAKLAKEPVMAAPLFSTNASDEPVDPETVHSVSVEALSEFMFLTGGGRAENPSASEKDIRVHCNRKTAHALAKASYGVIRNGVATAAEFRAFIDTSYPHLKGDLIGVEPIMIEKFITGHTCKVRPVTSIHWLVNVLHIHWDLKNVEFHLRKVKSQLGMDSRQAVVVTPPLLLQLEHELEAAMKAGTPTWPALWLVWVMTFGAVREEHLKRSILDKWTPGWMTLICPQGKTAESRGGFRYGMSTTFMSGFDWGFYVHALWSRVEETCPGQKRGLVVHTESLARFSASQVIAIVRDCMSDLLDEEGLRNLTGYGFRRVGMTIAAYLGLSVVDRLAWGNWKHSSHIAEAGESAITLRDAGNKQERARNVKEKIQHVAKLACATGVLNWDEIPDEQWKSWAAETSPPTRSISLC